MLVFLGPCTLHEQQYSLLSVANTSFPWALHPVWIAEFCLVFLGPCNLYKQQTCRVLAPGVDRTTQGQFLSWSSSPSSVCMCGLASKQTLVTSESCWAPWYNTWCGTFLVTGTVTFLLLLNICCSQTKFCNRRLRNRYVRVAGDFPLVCHPASTNTSFVVVGGVNSS